MPNPIIKIDGVTVEAIPGTLDIQSTIGNRATMGIGVWSGDGAYRPVVGKTLEVFEAVTKLWAGSVDEVLEYSISEGAPTGRRYMLRGVSWEQYLDRRFCYNAAGLHLRYSRNFEFSADLATDIITTTAAHGRANGNKVRVKAHAEGVLVQPLSATVEYFVISATALTLQLSLTLAGAAINLTVAGFLDQILVTYRAGEIVAALLVDAATSEPLGTANIDLGAVVDTVIWKSDVSVSDAIAQLADASAYVWWIDQEREVYFKPRTYAAAPFSISNTSGNYRNFSVRRTREDKCNEALMRVDLDEIGYEDESFVGTGSAVSFDLAFPVEQIIRMQVNGENKEYAIWLAEADRAFYYEYGGRRIRQDSDDAVLTSASTLRIIYRKLGADTIRVQDAADITATATLEGNSGIYGKPFERGGTTQTQAQVEGVAIVAAQKDVAAEILYETDQQVEPTSHTLRPGQIQTIANSYHNVSSGSYLIREVSLRDIGGRWLYFGVKAISTARLGGVVEFWKAMAGGGVGGAGSSGPSGLASGSTDVVPGNVTIVSADYQYIDAYRARVQIYWTPPAVLADFIGVRVWDEDPDISSIASTPMNSTQAMDGTSSMGGEWDPIDRGKGTRSPFVIEFETDARVAVTHRYYLASYSRAAEAALVRATSPSPTPSITLAIATPVYQSGVEYAQLAISQTATLEYDESQVASPKYRIRFGWAVPSSASAAWQRGFGGVQIVYEYADGRRANGPALALNETDATSDWYDLYVGTSIICCWFVSFDNSEEPRVNTIIAGVTPYVDVTLVWPLASRPATAPYADNVTGFDVVNPRYATTGAGQKTLLIDWAWTPPVGAAALMRWGGAVIYLFIPGEAKPYQITGAELGVSGVMEFSQFPQAAQTWTFFAISQDNNFNHNTTPAAPIAGTPTDTISVSPPPAGAAGIEYTSSVTGAAFAVATVTASDGTSTQRLNATFSRPVDVTWGGVEGRAYDGVTLVGRVTATASPWRLEIPNPTTSTTMTIKLVSYDVNGQVNTEAAGTPQGTVTVGSAAGTLDIRKFLPASTDNFSIVGSYLQIRTGVAMTVDAGGLLRVTVSGIDSTLIAAGAVLEAAIGTSAITVTKIATDAVTTPKIFAGAITTAKIAALAVTAAEIAAGAIVAGKIAALTIVAGDIAVNAIIAEKILAGAITTVKINAGAVSSDKLDATAINVGGGGSKPGKFSVFNAAGTNIGFIGTEGGNDGAWFKTIRVGGTSYSDGKLQADASGNVTMNGALFTLNLNGTTTTIENTFDGYVFEYVGLKVALNTGGYATTTATTFTAFATNNFSAVAQIGRTGTGTGFLSLNDVATSRAVSITSSSPRIVVTGTNDTRIQDGYISINSNQIISTRKTGWGTATGTPTRTTFATSTVTLSQLAERVKALIDDLHGTAGHGLIGT